MTQYFLTTPFDGVLHKDVPDGGPPPDLPTDIVLPPIVAWQVGSGPSGAPVATGSTPSSQPQTPTGPIDSSTHTSDPPVSGPDADIFGHPLTHTSSPSGSTGNTPSSDTQTPTGPIIGSTHTADPPVSGPDADIFGHSLTHTSSSPSPSGNPLDVDTVLTSSTSAPLSVSQAISPPPTETAPTAPAEAFVIVDDPPLSFTAHTGAGETIFSGAADSTVSWTSAVPMHFDTDVFPPMSHADASVAGADGSFFGYDWSWFDLDSPLHKSAADWFVV